MTYLLLDPTKEGRSGRGPAPREGIDLVEFYTYIPTITEATKHAIDVVCPPNV